MNTLNICYLVIDAYVRYACLNKYCVFALAITCMDCYYELLPLAGGESGDVNSPYFFDQGLIYSKGEFKDVLFYKEDVLKYVERKYHPGE